MRRLPPAVLLLTLLATYWIGWHAPAIGLFHDDGIYLATAKSMAEGRGYRIPSLPEEIPQTKYPVLFPALLAVAWKIWPQFPENTLLLKAVPLLFAGLWCSVIFHWVRREEKHWEPAVWVALTLAASPWMFFCGTALLSETLFGCLCWAALLHEGDDPRDVSAAALLASAAYLTRTAALPLIVAMAGMLILRRKFRAAARFLAICVLVIAPFALWQSRQAQPDGGLRYYTAASYRDWSLVFTHTLREKAVAAMDNLGTLLLAPRYNLGRAAYSTPLAVAISLVAMIGFCADCRRRLRALHVFTVLYCGALLLWAWPPERFVLPLVPCLLYYGWRGIALVLRRERLAAAVVAITFSVQACASLTYEVVRDRGHVAAQWDRYGRTFAWISAHTPKDAVVLSVFDPAVYLYTGRKGLRVYRLDPYTLYYSDKPREAMGTVEELRRAILAEGVTHVVSGLEDYSAELHLLDRLVLELEKRYPAGLRRRETGTVFRCYEVDPGALSAPAGR